MFFTHTENDRLSLKSVNQNPQKMHLNVYNFLCKKCPLMNVNNK